MSADVDWGDYVRGTANRYVTRYLDYAEAHPQPTAADYDALEDEQPTVLVAMDRAYRDERWEQVLRFATAFCHPINGYLGVRGYWSELCTRLEQAIRAAEASNDQYNLAVFREQRAALLMNIGDRVTARNEYQRVLEFWQAQGSHGNEAFVMQQLGVLAKDTGDYAEAQRFYSQSLEAFRKVGNRVGISANLKRRPARQISHASFGDLPCFFIAL